MKKEFLFSVTKKDFVIQTFASGGPGGQHQNKTQSRVRIVHKESGAVGESREERHQGQNKKIAFERLTKSPKFRIWLNKKAFEVISGKTIEEKVEEQIQEKNLKVEVRDDSNKWIIVEKDFFEDKKEKQISI